MIQKIFSFFEFIKIVPIIDLSNVIIKLITMIVIFANSLYNAFYKVNMHKYHNVPKKYFEKNLLKVIEELLIEITAIIIILIILSIIEYRFKGSRLFELAEYFLCLIILFLYIAVKTNQYRKDIVTIKEKIIYISVCCSNVVLYIICYWNFLHRNHSILLYIVTAFAFLIVSTYFNKSSEKRNFKYRDECEFVKINRKEYIIITHYENKVILQEIKYVNKKENKISINRNYFKIVELNDLDIYTKKNLTITNLVS